MKKIVFISDSSNFSKKTFEFLRSLYEKEPFLLTGAFFHSVNYGLVIPNTFAPDAGPFVKYTKHELFAYTSGIQEFKSLCLKHQIEYRVHQEGDEWDIRDFIKESRFADLVVMSGEHFFGDIEEEQPNEFLTQALSHAECPVLVVPDKAKPVKRIAVAYDGTKESMYALKLFSATFPGFRDLPTDIYYWVNKTDDDIPDLEYVEEFVGRHFSNANFREMFFDAEKYSALWLQANKSEDTIFVCGSYHRSKMSTWFRKSFSHGIIKEHAAIVFVAHTP